MRKFIEIVLVGVLLANFGLTIMLTGDVIKNSNSITDLVQTDSIFLDSTLQIHSVQYANMSVLAKQINNTNYYIRPVIESAIDSDELMTDKDFIKKAPDHIYSEWQNKPYPKWNEFFGIIDTIEGWQDQQGFPIGQ